MGECHGRQIYPLHPCAYTDTESYQVMEMFINNREYLLDRLLGYH